MDAEKLNAKIPALLLKENQILKKIHLIRHAQATSNAAADLAGESAYDSEEYVDALLTPYGESQCAALREKTRSSTFYNGIELVIISPHRRALQTATLVLDSFINTVPWIALHSLRETTGVHPCDRLVNKSITAPMFPHVNFDDIPEIDILYPEYERTREPEEHVTQRAREMFVWLAQRSETEIAIVGHSSYTDYLTANLLNTEPENCIRLRNCEARTFVVLLDKNATAGN